MSERGGYSPIARALRDGPDFQRLSPIARHVFYDLKIGFGPTGIEIHYPGALVVQLSHTTGWTGFQIEAALDELEDEKWIAREQNVVWIIGQLEFHATMNVKNKLHRKGVQSHAAGLPRLAIVGSFIQRYIAYFQGQKSPAQGYPKPFDSPSKGETSFLKPEFSPRKAIEGDSKHGDGDGDGDGVVTTSREDPAGISNGAPKPPRETWLSPICVVWESRAGAGSFATLAKQAAAALAPLVRAGRDPPEIAAHLEVYLARTEPKFRSVTKFAQTFAEWEPKPLVDDMGILTLAGIDVVR